MKNHVDYDPDFDTNKASYSEEDRKIYEDSIWVHPEFKVKDRPIKEFLAGLLAKDWKNGRWDA